MTARAQKTRIAALGMGQFILIALAFFAIGEGNAKADMRPYLVTYGYYTPTKGEVEIEQWTDAFVPKEGETRFRSRTELEYGVTDRLATAIYLVLDKDEGNSWEYDETKLEIRYRLTEPGQKFWDTAGYVELVRPSESSEPFEMEVKGIFSHEFPKFNVTVNLIAEKELAHGSKIEPGYAIGVSPNSWKKIGYSVEAFGEEKKHYIMPAVWLRGALKGNIGVGVAAGLTRDSDRLQVRTLYAHEF